MLALEPPIATIIERLQIGAAGKSTAIGDALGIALRFEAPIFISDEVIAKARPVEADGEALDDSEEGRKWKEYLEQLSPEDFGKYKV